LKQVLQAELAVPPKGETTMATLALCLGAAMLAGAITWVIFNPSSTSSIVAATWVVSGSIWCVGGLLLTALERLRHRSRLDNATPDDEGQRPN
jgi:glucose uptake protein GlcU